jgi:hypothetical protein
MSIDLWKTLLQNVDEENMALFSIDYRERMWLNYKLNVKLLTNEMQIICFCLMIQENWIPNFAPMCLLV